MTVRDLQMTARDGAGRCAVCHDALARDAKVDECARCGTRLHAECVGERCPTLGCGEATRPREAVAVPARPPRTWALVAFGVVMPLLCFGVNERMFTWNEPRSLMDLFSPAVHRCLYPLLAWALASLVASLVGRRAAWVEVGLWGGVALAAAFSAVYLVTIPFAAIGIAFYGVGLLGFGPYAALAAFVSAARHHSRTAPRGKDGEPLEDRSRRTVWFVWASLLLIGLATIVTQMVPWDR